MLIITCPCALALAIPAVQVVAAGALFRAGIFLNAGDAIERLAEVDTVVFDKTGTLTLPEPRVVNAARSMPTLLGTAARLAAVEPPSAGPALSREARERTRRMSGASRKPGRACAPSIDGIEARLGSPRSVVVERRRGSSRAPSVIAFVHGGGAAVFSIRQALRPDAAAVVAALAAARLRHARSCRATGPAAVAPLAARSASQTGRRA